MNNDKKPNNLIGAADNAANGAAGRDNNNARAGRNLNNLVNNVLPEQRIVQLSNDSESSDTSDDDTSDDSGSSSDDSSKEDTSSDEGDTDEDANLQPQKRAKLSD
ncbi:hypothetical protein KR093_004848 [Drosophila rubida]|uniref:Uncharacterized protein n=1 Tax=Drosophila rubida TaxID=30044 RepID=A0AAD4KAR4_9MUSC|nr:hypothetical protein KR093_004848 [Drosophila rubida]